MRSAPSAAGEKRLAASACRRPRAREEMLGEQRDVVAAFAQRRQVQAHDIEAVQQVGAEFAAFGFRVEVLVGRGDHAHVDADQLAAADAVELAVGEHAQQARLQRQRHVADLVEEQRAAIGLLEAAGVAARGAGERAGLVAEQFRFEQFGRNRRGVERDEWLAPRARFRGAARARRVPCRCRSRR